MRTKSKRVLAAALVAIMFFSMVFVFRGSALGDAVNLPSTIVWIEVSDGTESFFNTELSNVPSGYDVTNGTYPGWCVDRTAQMARSPEIHAVKLYSSLDPLGELAGERWDMVNYILNHKQGSAEDVQQAIWYFIDLIGNYSPTSSVAWIIVNDTLANGSGFVPAYGEMMAVIAFPMVLFPGSPDVQLSIIEVTDSVLRGDINLDGTVDVFDAILLSGAFDTKQGDPRWDPSCDLNGDLIIDILDAIILSSNFGESL